MYINKHEQFLALCQFFSQLAQCIALRLQVRIRCNIMSIKIFLSCILAVKAMVNTIRIQHRNYFENEMFTQKVGTGFVTLLLLFQKQVTHSGETLKCHLLHKKLELRPDGFQLIIALLACFFKPNFGIFLLSSRYQCSFFLMSMLINWILRKSSHHFSKENDIGILMLSYLRN